MGGLSRDADGRDDGPGIDQGSRGVGLLNYVRRRLVRQATRRNVRTELVLNLKKTENAPGKIRTCDLLIGRLKHPNILPGLPLISRAESEV
jgi:hypothetical protein